ncbi:unnamed protein product [Calicophoron daubneyi]|uniref:NADH dehydrogenase [ubiquinone] 1 beta subcomplex subunit 11, mitochondrial n=1 Tax=Calicophoron daubneyi TaxID=300641 RepID=A0AAV2TLI8_CALDB
MHAATSIHPWPAGMLLGRLVSYARPAGTIVPRSVSCIGCFKVPRTSFHVCTTLRDADLPSMAHILKNNHIPEADRKRIEEEVRELTKDWTCTGFHDTNKYEDVYRYNLLMFMVISFFSCGLFLYMWYLPNRGFTEWARREAFLELERRRRDGLPLVDPDLVPRSRVKLPTEEELGSDFKIII